MTATNAVRYAEIDWADGDCPVSPQFADKYYDHADPIAESTHVFLNGADIRASWRRKAGFAIGETGFGTGLNFLLTWDAWRNDAPDGWLTYLSLEKYPMSETDRRRALAGLKVAPDLVDRLAANMPPPFPGLHRCTFPDDRVRLIIVHGDAGEWLERTEGTFDAWYLDGFAPSRNPAMWSDRLFRALAARSHPGTVLSSFTSAGAVRRGLAASGFLVAKRPGFGGKRESIRATMSDIPAASGERDSPPWFPPCSGTRTGSGRIAIVGGGIAGLTLARSLADFGREVVLVDDPATRLRAASSLPAALIAPKLNRGDGPYSRFWITAFLDAVRALDSIPDACGIWTGRRGLTIAGGGATGAEKRHALCEELGWPGEWISADEGGTISIDKAGVVDPRRLSAWLSRDIETDAARITALYRHGDRWHLHDDAGKIRHDVREVVLTGGAWVNGLLGPDDRLPVRLEYGAVGRYAGRGQGPVQSHLADGYATATDPAIIGAALTHCDLGLPDTRAPDTTMRDRLDRIAGNLMPGWAPDPDNVWSGWRATSPDHLPIIGPLPDAAAFRSAYDGLRYGRQFEAFPPAPVHAGLSVMAALGPRGFQAAFLAADLLAARLCGLPSPVDRDLRHALEPARFVIRSLRRGG